MRPPCGDGCRITPRGVAGATLSSTMIGVVPANNLFSSRRKRVIRSSDAAAFSFKLAPDRATRSNPSAGGGVPAHDAGGGEIATFSECVDRVGVRKAMSRSRRSSQTLPLRLLSCAIMATLRRFFMIACLFFFLLFFVGSLLSVFAFLALRACFVLLSAFLCSFFVDFVCVNLLVVDDDQ